MGAKKDPKEGAKAPARKHPRKKRDVVVRPRKRNGQRENLARRALDGLTDKGLVKQVQAPI